MRRSFFIFNVVTLCLLPWLLGGCGREFEPDYDYRDFRGFDGIDQSLANVGEALSLTPDDPRLLRNRIALLLMTDSPEAAPAASRAFADYVSKFGMHPILGHALNSRNPVARRNAIQLLGLMHIGGTERLLRRAADDRDPAVRAAALRMLGGMQDARARFVILLSLKDPTWQVRAAAVNALVRIESGRSAIDALLPLLDDGDESVRFETAGALISIGTGPNAKQFRQILETAKPGGLQAVVATLALANAGQQDVLAQLVAITGDPASPCWMDAVRLLAGKFPARAKEFLPGLRSHPGVTSEQAEFIGRILNSPPA